MSDQGTISLEQTSSEQNPSFFKKHRKKLIGGGLLFVLMILLIIAVVLLTRKNYNKPTSLGFSSKKGYLGFGNDRTLTSVPGWYGVRKPLSDCTKKCLETPDCFGFTYDPEIQACWLKNNGMNMVNPSYKANPHMTYLHKDRQHLANL